MPSFALDQAEAMAMTACAVAYVRDGDSAR
jgi:hypothetical protein